MEKRQAMAKDLFCDECGNLISGEVWYINKVKHSIALDNPVFCSLDCLLKYLGVNSLPVDEFEEQV